MRRVANKRTEKTATGMEPITSAMLNIANGIARRVNRFRMERREKGIKFVCTYIVQDFG
jgi:hypothetical protein